MKTLDDDCKDICDQNIGQFIFYMYNQYFNILVSFGTKNQ